MCQQQTQQHIKMQSSMTLILVSCSQICRSYPSHTSSRFGCTYVQKRVSERVCVGQCYSYITLVHIYGFYIVCFIDILQRVFTYFHHFDYVLRFKFLLFSSFSRPISRSLCLARFGAHVDFCMLY